MSELNRQVYRGSAIDLISCHRVVVPIAHLDCNAIRIRAGSAESAAQSPGINRHGRKLRVYAAQRTELLPLTVTSLENPTELHDVVKGVQRSFAGYPAGCKLFQMWLLLHWFSMASDGASGGRSDR